MRKHVAILMLFQKQTMTRIFLIFTAMVAVQAGSGGERAVATGELGLVFLHK